MVNVQKIDEILVIAETCHTIVDTFYLVHYSFVWRAENISNVCVIHLWIHLTMGLISVVSSAMGIRWFWFQFPNFLESESESLNGNSSGFGIGTSDSRESLVPQIWESCSMLPLKTPAKTHVFSCDSMSMQRAFGPELSLYSQKKLGIRWFWFPATTDSKTTWVPSQWFQFRFLKIGELESESPDSLCKWDDCRLDKW